MPGTIPYTTGWIETTIHDFLLEIDEPSSEMGYALVTCLDSSFNVASLAGKSPRLRALKEQGRVVGKGVLLSTRRLLALERRQRMFFGFDEVWFFSQSQISRKPKILVITGPARISSELTGKLAEWMHGNSGSLGLGDGAGMNFCARLRGVAKYLVESFSESEANGSGNGHAVGRDETSRVNLA